MASVITSIGAVGGCWHLGDGSRPGEEPPVGLILCGEMKREQIALLQLDRGEIRVAKYLVELPPREMLEVKLGHRLAQFLLRHTFLTHAQIQHKNVFKPEISLLVIKDLKIDSSTFKWNL